jgi:16S rRNA (cytidine1402-2'-O)-methyltransferase
LTAALSIAGIPADKFVFLGFLPHKKGRQTLIKKIILSEWPVVLYESKYRITKLMEELMSATAEAPKKIIVGRELTKMFESVYRGSPETVLEELKKDAHNLKGEFVVIIYT